MRRPATLFTLGHSTHPQAEFIDILRGQGILAIADMRRFPGSRKYPHFNAALMAQWLPEAGIEYLPFPSLGGRRKPAKDSPNTGWRNESFRAYADYMQTEEFLAGLDELQAKAKQTPTAIMCAEAVPWRCHRSLIADALLVRGWKVMDVMSATTAKEHKLTPFAVVEGTMITYPRGADESPPPLFR